MQTLPALSYMPAYTYALTSSPKSRSVIDLSVAASQEQAFRYLAEAAVKMSLQMHGDSSAGIGSGRESEEALCNSLYAWLEHDALGKITDAKIKALQLIDWQECVTNPNLKKIIAAFYAIQGTFEFYVLDEFSLVPIVAAVVYLPSPPYGLYVLACNLSIQKALCTAVERLLHKFYVFGLVTQKVRELHNSEEPSWLRYALTPGSPFQLEILRETSYCQEYSQSDEDLQGKESEILSDKLKTLGYKLYSRRIYPQQEQQPSGELTIAQTRIEGMPLLPSEKQDSVWHLPNVKDLTLPREVLLPYREREVYLSRLYHENSKVRRFYSGYPVFSTLKVSSPVQQLLAQGVKDYHHAPVQYELPDVRHLRLTLPLEECILRRRSSAPLDSQPISLQDLAYILYFSYGVTGVIEDKKTQIKQPLRATPSGGALYPIDVYLVAHRVQGVEPGIYYHHPLLHRLQLVKRSYLFQEIAEHTGYGDRLQQAGALFIFVGALQRNQWKYRERGYRVILLDCGHLVQNVVLVASGLGYVGHPIMGFVDDYFNNLLGLDGVEEVVLYISLLGPRLSTEANGTHLPASS
jgi:SagB-type dehydrogenase family enzyme